MGRFFHLYCLLQASVALAWPAGSVPDDGVPWRFESTGRTLVIGDLHADADAYLSILYTAGLIDGDGSWAGKPVRIVKVGDQVSRGVSSRFIFDFDSELRSQGAQILDAVGNHEILRMEGDSNGRGIHAQMRMEHSPLRYPEGMRYQYLDLIAESALPVVRRTLAAFAEEEGAANGMDPLDRLEEVEDYSYFLAFTSRASPYAREIATRNTFIQVGEVLVVHAGIGTWMLEDIPHAPGVANATLRRYMDQCLDFHEGGGERPSVPWLADGKGPVWSRDMMDENVRPRVVKRILNKLGAKYLVVGHQVTQSRSIETRYGDSVFLADTGISQGFRGGINALLFEDNRSPIILDAIPRPLGEHSIRTRWEKEFSRRRRLAAPHVAALQDALQVREEEEDRACTVRLLGEA